LHPLRSHPSVLDGCADRPRQRQGT
jgi:hypothetical protein